MRDVGSDVVTGGQSGVSRDVLTASTQHNTSVTQNIQTSGGGVVLGVVCIILLLIVGRMIWRSYKK